MMSENDNIELNKTSSTDTDTTGFDDDNRRKFLRQAFLDSLAFEPEGDISEKEQDAFFEELVGTDFFRALDPKPTTMESKVLATSILAAEQQVENDLKELPRSQNAWWYQFRLAPTIEFFEKRGEGTPEQLVDLVVKSLRDRMPKTLAQSQLACMVKLRGELTTQQKREFGYFLTRNALGDLLLTDPNRKVLLHRLFHYITSVDSAITLVGEQSKILIPIHFASAMAANVLAKLDTDLPGTGAFHELSYALKLYSTSTSPENPKRVSVGKPYVSAVAKLFPNVILAPETAAVVLIELGTAPRTWIGGQDETLRLTKAAFHESVVGCLLANSSELPSAASSSWFNAGISLLRREEDGTLNDQACKKNQKARVVVNVIGAWMASRHANSPAEWLNLNQGSNCIVNLVGNAATAKGLDENILGLIKEFAQSIDANHFESDDGIRFNNSLKQLNVVSGTASSLRNSQEQLEEMLRLVLDLSGNVNLNDPQFVVQCVQDTFQSLTDEWDTLGDDSAVFLDAATHPGQFVDSVQLKEGKCLMDLAHAWLEDGSDNVETWTGIIASAEAYQPAGIASVVKSIDWM